MFYVFTPVNVIIVVFELVILTTFIKMSIPKRCIIFLVHDNMKKATPVAGLHS